MTQYDRIARLLTRKTGCTAMDITTQAGTVSAHSRMAEMKSRGWVIKRLKIAGKTYGRYYGEPPADPCFFHDAGQKQRKAMGCA